jgi:hypothetical protein
VQAVPPGQGPGLPLLHLQMLAIVTSQAASDRATRAARERVMARIFQLSVSEDVYWFVCCWGLCCKTMQYHAIPCNINIQAWANASALRVATYY